MPVERNSRRIGCSVNGCRTHTSSLSSAAGSITPTGSDCHDPHSGKLKASGDGVCLQCHSSDKYAGAAHNHHDAVKPPVACASCHMPTHTYTVVDRRHDHSVCIPRPDLSVKLGTPNACNDCHTDKSAEWAASVIESWYGPNREGFQNYAEAFHAAWADQPDAATLLAAVAARSPQGASGTQRSRNAFLDGCVG
jgi:predicted CXXCH cytochrome family protein